MFRIETYTNPLTFYNSRSIGMDEIHITSIPVLAMHLKEQVPQETKGLKWHIFIYHHFYKALYPKWNSNRKILDMKQILRYLIRTEVVYENDRERLLKQVSNLCEIFRYWMIVGVTELPIEEQDGAFEKIKLRLYESFRQQPEIIALEQEIRVSLNSEYIAQKLSEFCEKNYNVTHMSFTQIKRIYIYAMDYLEPIRYQFFKQLSDYGYEVIFRIPYDEKFPNVYKGWREVYNLIVPISEWQKIQEDDEVTSSLLYFLEGKDTIDKKGHEIYVHTYHEPTSFKKYLASHPLDRKKREYLACEADQLNEVFRDELDPEREMTHIFETPVGRFIGALYKVKLKSEQIQMDYEMYREMITSGLVITKVSKDKVMNGLEAMSLLSDLSQYMEGVSSLEAIKERLQKLKQLHEVSEIFDELARSKVDRHQVKRYLQNPFRTFSFINPTGYEMTLNQLIMVTDTLEKRIQDLLIEHSPIDNMKEHSEHLVQYIREALTYQKQQAHLERLYEIFLGKFKRSNYKVYEWDEVNEYISVLGKVPSEKHQKGELVLIKGLEQSLGLCVNGVEAIELCDLSTRSMDQAVRARIGRIELSNLDTLKKYSTRVGEDTDCTRLQEIITIGKMVGKHTQNFIKFNLMTLLTYYPGELHLGWIKNRHAYDTEWYLLSILKQIYNVGELEKEEELQEFLDLLEESATETQGKMVDVETLSQQISPFAWTELEKCKKKFYYTNILNYYPVYHESFSQRIAFGYLSKLLEDQLDGKQQVIEQVFPLFPQWPYALKQNIVETTPKCEMKEYLAWDNIEFPKDMMALWQLGQKGYKEVSLEQKKKLLKECLDEGKEITGTIGKQCYFCPHQLICMEGGFGIDGAE